MDTLTYAAYNKNESDRFNSSSGGIFALMAKYILNCGGVVYGVAMTSECDAAEFIRVSNIKDLEPLMCSKYMQARLGNTFNLVKKDLEQDTPVLFTGTGCQINGLKTFLNKLYFSLYCIDVVCHGTPSPKLWKKYIMLTEEKYSSKIKAVNFRYKDVKCKDFGIKATLLGKKQIFISKKTDLYMQMFLNNLSLRPSCYECTAKKHKLADISIADFWGIDTIAPKINDNKGISMVILRNEHGKQLFDAIKKNIYYQEVCYKDAVYNNSAEYSSVKRPEKRDLFFEDLNQMQFDDLAKKYVSISLKKRVKCVLLKSPLKYLMRAIEIKGNENYGILFTLEK